MSAGINNVMNQPLNLVTGVELSTGTHGLPQPANTVPPQDTYFPRNTVAPENLRRNYQENVQSVPFYETSHVQNPREWSQIPASQPQSATSRTNVKKMDVEKWRLKFDGTSKTINAEDFIFRLEQLRQDYQCDWDEVLVKFPQLLEGPAED